MLKLRFAASLMALLLTIAWSSPALADDEIPWGEISAYLTTGQAPEILRILEAADPSKLDPAQQAEDALAGTYFALVLGRHDLAAHFAERLDGLALQGPNRYLQLTLGQALAYRREPGEAREHLAKRWREASSELAGYKPNGKEGFLLYPYVLGASFGLWLEQAIESEIVLDSEQLPLLQEIQATARRVALEWAAPEVEIPTLGVYLAYLEAATEAVARLDHGDPLAKSLSLEPDFAKIRELADASPPAAVGQPGEYSNREIADAFLNRVTATYQLRMLERLNEGAAGRTFSDEESVRVRELLNSLKTLVGEGLHIGNLMRYYVVGTETALHSQKTGWEAGILKLLESPPQELSGYPWLEARALVVRSLLRRRAGQLKGAQADSGEALRVYRELARALDAGGLLRLRRAARPAFEARVDACLAASDVENAFQAAWTYLALESQASLPNQGPAALSTQSSAQLAAKLSPDQRFLLYFPEDDRLLIFALDPKGLSWSAIALKRKELSDGVQRIRRALVVRQGAQRLAGTPWDGPAAASRLIDSMPPGRPKEVIIGAPSFLINCPWSYLLASSARFAEQPLSYRVSDLSGRAEATVVLGSMLAMGNPDGSLPAAQTEVESLVTVVPNAVVAVGDKARRSLLSGFSGGTLHLATHGTIDPRLPSASYLLLAGPDHLLASQVEGLNLPVPGTELVVLSACNSGAHALDDTGLRSLSGAFLRSGAKRVVGTLWPVNDEATSVLMLRFYQELATGQTPERALLVAQSALRESEAYSDPNLWAPFTIYSP